MVSRLRCCLDDNFGYVYRHQCHTVGVSAVKAETLAGVRQTLRAIVVLHAGVKRDLLDLLHEQFPGKLSA